MPALIAPVVRQHRNPLDSFTLLEWIMLVSGSIVCGFAAVWIGQMLGIPLEPGFGGSLLASGSPVLGIIIAAIAMVVGTVIGSILTAAIQSEAGLFCACLGLGGLAVRCGPIRPVIQYASSASVFLLLSLETALLAIIVLCTWIAFRKFFSGTILLRPSLPATPNELADAPIEKKLMALGVQMVAMGVLELIFIQSDALAQGLMGVGSAAYLSVLVAYMFMPMSEGVWYWMGPTVLGVLAFLLAYFNGGVLATGEAHGWAAALARVTPLGYASAGTAVALLGYWCIRRWSQSEEAEAATQ